MSFLSPRPLSEDELARFPSFVRAGRALLGVTQQRLAQAAGLSLATLNNLEREVHTPRVATLEAIAEVLALHGVVFSNEQGRAHLSYDHTARPAFQSPAPGETRLDLMRMWESQLAPTSLLACDSVLFYAFDKLQTSGAPSLPPVRGFGIYLRAGTRQLLWDRADLSLEDQTKAAEFGHLMAAAWHFAADGLFFIPHPLRDTRDMPFTEAVEFLSQQDRRPLDHPLPLCLLLAAWEAIETWVRQSAHPLRALMLLAEADVKAGEDAGTDADTDTGTDAGADTAAPTPGAGMPPSFVPSPPVYPGGVKAGSQAGGTSRKRAAKSSRKRESPAPRSASGKARKVPLSSPSPAFGPPAGSPPAPPGFHPGPYAGPHAGPGPPPDGAYAFQEGAFGGRRPLPPYPPSAPSYPYAPGAPGFYAPGYAPGAAPPLSHPLPPGVPGPPGSPGSPGSPGAYAPPGAYPHPTGVPFSPPGPYASGPYPAPGFYPPVAEGHAPESGEETPSAPRVSEASATSSPPAPDVAPPRPSGVGSLAADSSAMAPPDPDPHRGPDTDPDPDSGAGTAPPPSAAGVAGDEAAGDEPAPELGYDEENWI